MNESVSVIICSHDLSRYEDLLSTIFSVSLQSYKRNKIEIIVVDDGWGEITKKLESTTLNIKIITNPTNLGLSESRNKGIEESTGDIIAFLDDDAVAHSDWIKNIIDTYAFDYNVLAVGGKILPLWETNINKPRVLPPEFYWLIGATPSTQEDVIAKIRNTFGSNMSFRREVIGSVGGFSSSFGVKGSNQMQGEEADFFERMRKKTGGIMLYNPGAIVYHRVFKNRIKPWFLFKRAFMQGVSKSTFKKLGYSTKTESNYFIKLIDVIVDNLFQTIMIIIFTNIVAIGYFYGRITRRFHD